VRFHESLSSLSSPQDLPSSATSTSTLAGDALLSPSSFCFLSFSSLSLASFSLSSLSILSIYSIASFSGF